MKYSKKRLEKIFNEHKPTPKLMSLELQKYGPRGLKLLKDLAKLREDDRSKEIPTE